MPSLFELFWLLFILGSLQPLFRKRVLELQRQRMIARCQQHRGSRVILLVHRQETMTFLGFPLIRYIDINDAEEVIRAVNMTDPEIPLDLVLHTPGGLVLPSVQIARAIRKHPGKVTVFVPHYAMSGGTLIALGADQIVMSRHAVLGPVDPQIGQYPAASLLEVLERKPIAEIDDETLILADMGRKARKQLSETIHELLADQHPEEKIEALSGILTEGAWTHDYPITFEKALELGLPVSDDMPELFLTLLSLFPQPVKRTRTVEYIPEPRHKQPVARAGS